MQQLFQHVHECNVIFILTMINIDTMPGLYTHMYTYINKDMYVSMLLKYHWRTITFHLNAHPAKYLTCHDTATPGWLANAQELPHFLRTRLGSGHEHCLSVPDRWQAQFWSDWLGKAWVTMQGQLPMKSTSRVVGSDHLYGTVVIGRWDP